MKRWILIARLFLLRSGVKRGQYLRNKNIFYHVGKNCYFHPSIITTEPYLVSIGDNVSIASGVKFITHDVIGFMIDKWGGNKSNAPCELMMGKIEIGNNVAIGQGVHILYNTKIGSNVVVAAGSIVCKDIPDNSVAAGIPCRVIGKFDDFVEKRNAYNGPRTKKDINEIITYFWNGENK